MCEHTIKQSMLTFDYAFYSGSQKWIEDSFEKIIMGYINSAHQLYYMPKKNAAQVKILKSKSLKVMTALVYIKNARL